MNQLINEAKKLLRKRDCVIDDTIFRLHYQARNMNCAYICVNEIVLVVFIPVLCKLYLLMDQTEWNAYMLQQGTSRYLPDVIMWPLPSVIISERFANAYCTSNLFIVKSNITSKVSFGIEPESQFSERRYLDFYFWTPIILLVQVSYNG